MQGNQEQLSPNAALNVQTLAEQIGAKLTLLSSRTALQWLLNKAALSGLDIQETAALLASVFTEMETRPTQSMSDLARILTPIFDHWQRNGGTVSERAEIAAQVMNILDTGAEWSTRRDSKGRTYVTITPL